MKAYRVFVDDVRVKNRHKPSDGMIVSTYEIGLFVTKSKQAAIKEAKALPARGLRDPDPAGYRKYYAIAASKYRWKPDGS